MSFEWIVFLCLFVVTAIVLALWWFLQIFIVAQSTVSLVLNTSTKQVKLLNTGLNFIWTPTNKVIERKERQSGKRADRANFIQTTVIDMRSRLLDLPFLVLNTSDNKEVFVDASVQFKVLDALVLIDECVYTQVENIVVANLARAAASLDSDGFIKVVHSGHLRGFLCEGLAEITPKLGFSVEALFVNQAKVVEVTDNEATMAS